MINGNANFFQARLKLDWSRRHLNHAKHLWDVYLKTEFCKIGVEDFVEDGEHAGQSLFIDTQTTPPYHVFLLIMNSVHDARCTLDYVITELLQNENSSLSFPFAKHEAELHSKFGKRGDIQNGGIKRTRDGPFAILEEKLPGLKSIICDKVQPYLGGQSGIWVLNKLDNIGKHRTFVQLVVPNAIHGIDAHLGDIKVLENCTFRIKNFGRGVLFIVGNTTPKLEVTKQHKPTASLFFQEDDVPNDIQVFDLLEKLQKEVEIVVDCIDQFATKSGWTTKSLKAIRPENA